MSYAETDYLIIGAGAVGLAFADTLLSENSDCHITLVDKHPRPGGHWNDAYGFVALHQPSATYGVNSMPFPYQRIDTSGANAGLHSLATGAQVLAYFENVMNERLLPSGRVAYYPSSEFLDRNSDSGIAKIRPLLSSSEINIKVRRKLVDATFYQTSVPSTHRPNFAIEGSVDIIPPNDLFQLWKRQDPEPAHFVVLGAGKTAMDTVIWLLQQGVDADNISWVRPRESWLINRAYVQPTEAFFESVMEMQTALLETAGIAEDSSDLMHRLGEQGYYLRVDPTVEPTMFHYAIISEGEIELLRTVARVIRKGRVHCVRPGELEFSDSRESVPEQSVFIDCTASAVPFSVRGTHPGPIFNGDRIVLQPVQVPLVVLSSAIAAYLEAACDTDEERNAMATPAPLTDSPATFAYGQVINMMNRGAWRGHPGMMKFLANSRLDLTTGTIAALTQANSPKLAALQQFGAAVKAHMPAFINLGMQAKAVHESEA